MRLERNWGRLGMKSNYTIKPLVELADIQTGPFGSQLHKEDYVEDGTPIVTVEHLGNKNFTEQNLPCVSDKDKERLCKYVLKTGDVVFSRVGSVDRCSYVSDRYDGWMFSGRCLRVRPKDEIDAQYLYYYFLLETTKKFVRGIATGATMPSINTKFMGEVPISYPSKTAQKRIANILGAIDEKIEINKSINDNLLQQASAIYQAWFEDSILADGSVSSTWKQGTLADIANVSSGKRPPVKSAVKTDTAVIPLVGAASIMGYTTEANHTDKILVTGRVGTHGVIQRFNSPCWTSDNTLVITSDFYEYTYQILQRIDYNSMNRGSTQPLITQGDMNKVSILIPDQETLHDFETLVGQLMEQYQSNILENNKLAEIRDSLLPQLMSGELDVSDINI